jgi:hypothetical protein
MVMTAATTERTFRPMNETERSVVAHDGGGLAKGGDVTLVVDGGQVGTGRVNATVPMVYSADETCDVGSDTGTTVSDDYPLEDSHFTGTVNRVLDAGQDDHDHSSLPKTDGKSRWPTSSRPSTTRSTQEIQHVAT